jgi:hypothetical protein
VRNWKQKVIENISKAKKEKIPGIHYDQVCVEPLVGGHMLRLTEYIMLIFI